MLGLLGRVGNRLVTVQRDTGCNRAVVKAQFVEKEQYLKNEGYKMMMDKTQKKERLHWQESWLTRHSTREIYEHCAYRIQYMI